MPRSNRPRRPARPRGGPAGGGRGPGSTPTRRPGEPDALEQRLGLDAGYSHQDLHDCAWHVREIPAWRAVKDYTCPGCGRTIPPGMTHVVAWRSDWILGDEDAGQSRRHWHRTCWRTRRQDGR